MTLRLLIVDDDPGIASALARGMAIHGYEAQTEMRADTALAHLLGGGFSAAIVDVMLGEDSGIDLVREARAAGVDVPVLMLSALSEVEQRAAGLEAGADDYVVKPFSLDELVARLRVQEKRAEARRPQPATFRKSIRLLCLGPAEVTLTEREADLLLLLVGQGSEPLARGDIFDALWGADGAADAPGSENVVDVYIGYVRKKLARQDFGFGIRTVRNKGFCIEGIAPQVLS
ncbi:response regulator transcription factor [Sagittula stellata]|uniref:Putative two-component response regulator n=1 Tax=Sagittula stellata (strain ATCC 700073 / DSM 11524 / E-37) TaxID=388399 RepID=A3KAV6_SAGS3|nr:response regulator transcription factor [Sagittula stellata]EBA05684.1 putative two-component response regulator [Sagittula stellata E-37]